MCTSACTKNSITRSSLKQREREGGLISLITRLMEEKNKKDEIGRGPLYLLWELKCGNAGPQHCVCPFSVCVSDSLSLNFEAAAFWCACNNFIVLQTATTPLVFLLRKLPF